MKIEFIPAFDFVSQIDIDPPRPAINFMPKWYKDLSVYLDPNFKNFRSPVGKSNLSAKACMPLIDSMSTGYIITTPCELEFVDQSIYNHRVIWEMKHKIITDHTEVQVEGINLEGFEARPLKFEGIWRIRVPKGYSLLYTHPFWHFDLPFLSATGIVDSDGYDTAINIPFFIKKGFTGTLPKGSPISQIIPIKREHWKSKVQDFDKSQEIAMHNIKLLNFRSYKKRFWRKKRYE